MLALINSVAAISPGSKIAVGVTKSGEIAGRLAEDASTLSLFWVPHFARVPVLQDLRHMLRTYPERCFVLSAIVRHVPRYTNMFLE